MGKGAVIVKQEPLSQAEVEQREDGEGGIFKPFNQEKSKTLTVRSGFALSSRIISAAMKRNKLMRDRNQGSSKITNNLIGVMAIKMKF